jgi:hypothetical protein
MVEQELYLEARRYCRVKTHELLIFPYQVEVIVRVGDQGWRLGLLCFRR